MLVLNLPLVGEAAAVRQCAASPNEPTWLTLRALRGWFAVLAAFPDADGWCMHPDSGRHEEELVEELLNDLRVRTSS